MVRVGTVFGLWHFGRPSILILIALAHQQKQQDYRKIPDAFWENTMI
jgi:hypothetical protein